jgi:RNA polymerase sigma-70 factor (ECF subfamily)
MGDGPNNLAAKARAGDRSALNALLERHLNVVYRFVSATLGPHDANLDDVVQETLLGAAKSVGGLRGESQAQVAGWLISIARHKVADHLRGQYNRAHESLDGSIGEAVPDPMASVDQQVEERDRAVRLREALRELTPEQEEILMLRFILGFGIEEVAEITRRPPGAVKSMQHRALASLQRKLGQEEAAWH